MLIVWLGRRNRFRPVATVFNFAAETHQCPIAERLLKRAMGFMDAAKERFEAGDYDLACFMAEQAVQLYLKSLIFELIREPTR